jgi:hypothetical protein
MQRCFGRGMSFWPSDWVWTSCSGGWPFIFGNKFIFAVFIHVCKNKSIIIFICADSMVRSTGALTMLTATCAFISLIASQSKTTHSEQCPTGNSMKFHEIQFNSIQLD